MFFVFEFDGVAEDWKVSAHSNDRQNALILGAKIAELSYHPVVVVDGVHPDNRVICETHIGRVIDPIEFGNWGRHVETFEGSALPPKLSF
jgi:hypothetical protein